MKLLGIEFQRFACFEKYFLPIQPGINLLVGKNNTGKTALLRGISALKGLPINPSSEIQEDVSGYVHGDSNPPSFGLQIRFRLESNDPNIYYDVLHAPPEWEEHVQQQKPVMDFSLSVGLQARRVKIEKAELVYGNRSVTVLVNDEQGKPMQWQCNLEGKVISRKPAPTQHTVNGINIFDDTDLFAGFRILRKLQVVRAHRVVSDNLPLQTSDTLSDNAQNLAQLLQTLQGKDRASFESIEKFVTTVFPEFRYINAESANNTVTITATLKDSARIVKLSNCGTGVEQILSLATFVITSPPGTLILLDEPHSYLHPASERSLIDFLNDHKEHIYIIATHSPVIINSVPPERINYLGVTKPEDVSDSRRARVPVPEILEYLGYKNSDLVFNDRLIFVEGESDQRILPILLRASGAFHPQQIANTGFPIINGAGPIKAKRKQSSILAYEKLIGQIGRARLPRFYLLDGDCNAEDHNLLQGSRTISGTPIAIKFLSRSELENYLLVPEAITRALQDELKIVGLSNNDVSEEETEKKIDVFLKSDKENHAREAKGSAVLKRIFAEYQLNYDKVKSGSLIAKHISIQNQPALQEIVGLVKELFE